MKHIVKISSIAAPNITANYFYNKISTPNIPKLKHHEEVILKRSEQKDIMYESFNIKSYKWGFEKNPIILLVHGWGGQAGNFGAIINILLEKKYQVLAFDAPSHGKSSKGKTHIFEYANFITEMLNVYNPVSVISHSFGTVSSILALARTPKLKINQWFIITTPFSFNEYLNNLKKNIGVSDNVLNILIRKIELQANSKVEDINMEKIGKQLQSFPETTIIHSNLDKVISINDSRRTQRHIKNSVLIEIENHGHYSILWSDELKHILKNKLDIAV